jgi:hypothetical protein
VYGLDGDDSLFGNSATMEGGEGNDVIVNSSASYGGDGNDSISTTANVTLAVQTAYGGAGNDAFFAINFSSPTMLFYGDDGNDTINAADQRNGFYFGRGLRSASAEKGRHRSLVRSSFETRHCVSPLQLG